MTMNECKPFDCELAVDLSMEVHKRCPNCPHDIGITLAIVAYEFYEKKMQGD